MKRFLQLAIMTSFVFMLAGCKENTPIVLDTFELNTIKTTDKAYIFGALDSVNIMKDVKVKTQCDFWGEEWLQDTNKLYGTGIRGEVVAMQLMFTARENISSFTAKANALTNGTSKIKEENVSLFAERYIEVKAPSSTSKKASMFSGWYADALVPIDSYSLRKENKVAKDENQGIWINITLDRNLTKGLYTGSIDLNLDEEIINVPYSVYVYDASLSLENHCVTSFGLWEGQIGFGEELEDENGVAIDWATKYYDFLISKKITPQHIPNEVFGSKFAKEVVKYAKDPLVTSYSVPYKGETHDFLEHGKLNVVNYNALVTQLTEMAKVNIELRKSGDNTDLFKKAYFYFGSIIDEPSSVKYDAVRYCDLAVTNAKKEVAKLLNDYPDLKESLLRVPHVVTTSYVDSLYGDEVKGGVQTWCTEAQRFSKLALETVKTRKESTERYSIGEGQWVYVTCTSNNPYPSFQLDDNLLGMRALEWMSFDYGIQATLFWNTCYYQKYNGSDSISRDIWNDPNSWAFANGDGMLLYPGSHYNLDTPLATLRLESFSQGVEDYDYLYQIREILENYNEKHTDKIDVEKVMSKIITKMYVKETLIPTTNVKQFENVRTLVLELLEKLTNDSNNAKAIVERIE